MCQHQNYEALPRKTISSSFISIGGVLSIQVSPLLTSTLFCYGDTPSSFAFSACVITSIYHRLIYIDNNSIVNSLQQNSRLLKQFFPTPINCFVTPMPSSSITFSTFPPFMWVFLSKEQSKTTFTEGKNLVDAPSYSNPLGLPLYNYWLLLNQHCYLTPISHTCFAKSCLLTNRLHLFFIGNLIKHINLHY